MTRRRPPHDPLQLGATGNGDDPGDDVGWAAYVAVLVVIVVVITIAVVAGRA